MHIPDGYLNIPSCCITYGLMGPIWYVAGKKLKKQLAAKEVPLLALGAAFSFVLMMLNFPLPGGSSGHAVGGALLAIVLGPWAALTVLSVVLAIQAFLFHDGGLTTLGANALNMAFILPFTASWIYARTNEMLAGLFRKKSILLKGLASALAGYFGLSCSAFTTALLLGIQPHGLSGYAPYPLSITIPVMVGSHLLVFSWIEAFFTAFALVWIMKTSASESEDVGKPEIIRPSFRSPLLVLAVLLLLTPLGLLTKQTAFGEWSLEELKKLLGYVPRGLINLSRIWKSPLPGYQIPGHSLVIGYLFSAFLGTVATAFFVFILIKALLKATQITPADKLRQAPPPLAFNSNKLPEWIQKKEKLLLDSGKIKISFLEKTVEQIDYFLALSSKIEQFQKEDGFLQQRDPRVKIIAFSILIFLAAWLKSPLCLFPLLGAAFVLAFISKIPILWYTRQVLLTMAIFSLLLALPAMLSAITPGHPLVTLYPLHLVLTREGVFGVLLFVLRATSAIALSTLLAFSTPWTKLLKSLQFLKIPQIFLFIVEMSYRYVFLFARLVEQMNLSKKSRMISPSSLENEQLWSTGRMAFLLKRSLDLAENVYTAMMARGYDGRIKTLDTFKLNYLDKVFAVCLLLFTLTLIFFSTGGNF